MYMFQGTVLCIPRSEAIRYAAQYLSGIGITVTERAAPDVTHLLLPVPSFPAGDEYLAHILADLPDDVIVSGGNLNSPLLEHYAAVDFLTDPYYLASNAAITAECAVKILQEKGGILSGKSVLILGWGRIGKCLGRLLRNLGADVTISARRSEDLAMLRALDYRCILTHHAGDSLSHFDAVINTIPEMILPKSDFAPGCVALELASKPGMTGKHIINGRGLPGRMAAVKSGKLIAETFIRLSI